MHRSRYTTAALNYEYLDDFKGVSCSKDSRSIHIARIPPGKTNQLDCFNKLRDGHYDEIIALKIVLQGKKPHFEFYQRSIDADKQAALHIQPNEGETFLLDEMNMYTHYSPPASLVSLAVATVIKVSLSLCITRKYLRIEAPTNLL